MPRMSSDRRTVAFDSITVSNTAVGLTQSNVRGSSSQPMAEEVLLTVETDQIRWRDDGTDPTSSVGHLVNPGGLITLSSRDRIEKFRAIRVTTNATLRVSYIA